MPKDELTLDHYHTCEFLEYLTDLHYKLLVIQRDDLNFDKLAKRVQIEDKEALNSILSSIIKFVDENPQLHKLEEELIYLINNNEERN